jgi:hypothetical protein
MYPDHPPHTFWSTQPTGGPLFSCDWPGCTSAKLFSNQIARSQHVSATHILDVLQNTSGSCTWPGCIKSKLDTCKKLETHVVNIHIEPLRCAFSGCRRTAPFGRKGDLDRHIASIHKKERSWKCPRRNCIFYIKGFSRKDKLNEHLRTKGHGALKCEYRHCGRSAPNFAPFLTEAELLSHCDDDHGNFECGIGSCANTSSAFTPRTLRFHVFYYHCSPQMDYENISAIVYQIAERSQTNTCTITKGDFDGLEISNTCEECVDRFQPNAN